jgi:predicted flap endonuclease-1-like 5' DNA nuclease
MVHVLDPATAGASPAEAAAPPEPVAPVPEPPPITRTALEDDESAAMRAIEGGWTPRRASRAAQRPVPHPEQAAPAAEVDDAMQTARSAVAAATAAAAAAIAEAQERPHRPAPDGLSFEQRSEEMARSFLADPPAPAGPANDDESAEANDDVLPADPSAGLVFEPAHPRHHGFGRPEALPEPRDGRPDNLKQIRGITPSLEASLHGLGIFHFDQIAGWDQKAVVWIDNHLSLRGHIVRDRWLEQARDLAARSHAGRPVRR